MILEPPTLDTAKLHSIPGIREQTPWRTEFFDFGKAKVRGTDFFNPAITRIGDSLWLVARRAIDIPGQLFGMNDLVAFELRGMLPARGVKIAMGHRFDKEQFEDPRVLQHNGRVWVSCCDFIWQRKKWTGAHQIITEVTRDWNYINRYDPMYGGNGYTLGQNKSHEKNWLWFVHDGKPHLIYKAYPHEVVAFNSQFVSEKSKGHEDDLSWPVGYKTHWACSAWNYGEMRGGTNPILVGDEYYTFFHSSTPWMPPKRQYHMGCYTFESKPPFKVKRITTTPLLSGSQKDPWSKGKPLVVFPCGAVFENGNFTVSMGINDICSAWIEIPKDDLDDQMIEV